MTTEHMPYGKPYYIRYPTMKWDRDKMIDTCWQGIADKKWVQYNDSDPTLKFSDLIIPAPAFVQSMFKKQIWNWCNFTWIHKDGELKAHVHNGPITKYIKSNKEFDHNPSAEQIREWSDDEGKLVRAPVTVALFFPVLGIGTSSHVTTQYYDGKDGNLVDQFSLICPTLLRVDLWHSVYNLNGPNRFMFMLNFNDPCTLEEADALVRENALTL